MPIVIESFSQLTNESRIFIDFNIQEKFDHKNNTWKFDWLKWLQNYLEENTDIAKLYLTREELENNCAFLKQWNELFVNIDSYIEFYRTASSKANWRTKAFFWQNIRANMLSWLLTNEQRIDIIGSANEDDMRVAIDLMDPIKKSSLVRILQENQQQDASISVDTEISTDEVISSLWLLIGNPQVQASILENTPKYQLSILESNKEFIINNLNASETTIQNWIDEENWRYRKQRCLIFWIDLIAPKREWMLMNKRYDILMTHTLESHVIVELKWPSADIFKIIRTNNPNEWTRTEYHLSDEVSRAIPQILWYKRWYATARPEEVQAMWISEIKPVSRCIIVIWKRCDTDPVWIENFISLKIHLHWVEIITYTDLIDSITNTINNLRNLV